jgi:hypothetical protein
MTTVTVLNDTFGDATTALLTARAAETGGNWTAIEVSAGNGPDSSRVIGGTGNAFSNSGSSASGNRSAAVLTTTDWDVYFDVIRPSGVFGGLWIMGGSTAAGVGGWTLLLDNFNDNVRLFSDSTSYTARGPERLNIGHVMPTGTSSYQLRKRGAVLNMWRNGVQLGIDWTDPDPTVGNGVVAFRTAASDNLGVSRVWATIEDTGGGATANGATLVATASLIAGSASGPVGTLNFQAAGMEFGRRTGLGISTFALDASQSYRYTVHADGLVLGAPIFTSGVVSTDATGKLPNVTNAAFAAGTTVWVCAVRQADGQRALFPMVVA